MKKYRVGKIKREHSIIEGLWPVLEQMSECDLITTIIPGPISRLHGRGFELTFQRFTETGLRLLAKNGSAVQEVYAVAPEKQATLAWLAHQGLVDWKPEPTPTPLPPTGGKPLKVVVIPKDTACLTCSRPIMAGSRAYRVDRKPFAYIHTRCVK